MPLIRKLIKVGNSKAITLPADWLRMLSNDKWEISAVSITQEGMNLKIKPHQRKLVKEAGSK